MAKKRGEFNFNLFKAAMRKHSSNAKTILKKQRKIADEIYQKIERSGKSIFDYKSSPSDEAWKLLKNEIKEYNTKVIKDLKKLIPNNKNTRCLFDFLNKLKGGKLVVDLIDFRFYKGSITIDYAGYHFDIPKNKQPKVYVL